MLPFEKSVKVRLYACRERSLEHGHLLLVLTFRLPILVAVLICVSLLQGCSRAQQPMNRQSSLVPIHNLKRAAYIPFSLLGESGFNGGR